MKIGLAALAAGALVVAGNALVTGVRSGGTDPFSDASRIAALPAQRPPAAPPSAADTAAAEAAVKAELEAAANAEKAEKAKKQAEAAKKAAAGSSGLSTIALVNCTKQVTSGAALTQAISAAKPGEKICATGNMGGRLNIAKGGTTAAPVQVIGSGSTAVKGITVEASNVVVSGFSAVNPQAPGIELTGNNITVSNNKVKSPTGGDHDGLRFFGNNLKILNNTISDVSPQGTGAHADCMQTFQSGTPSSKNVVIDGNRCERVDNMCLMAEGPGDQGDGGEGQGESSNWQFTNNYCDTHAGQALMIEAVQNVTVKANQVVGKVDKAFAFDIGSTGAKVLANKLAPGIGYEVGMDSSSKNGYQGPTVGGAP